MRAVDVFVHPVVVALGELVARVDRGELRIDVDRRVTLADLPSVHAEADAGTLRGKVIVTATPA